MTIAEAIAIAIMPRHHTSLVSPDSLKSKISLPYFMELQKFASATFWTELVKNIPETITLSDEQRVLLEHIRQGIEAYEEEQNTTE